SAARLSRRLLAATSAVLAAGASPSISLAGRGLGCASWAMPSFYLFPGLWGRRGALNWAVFVRGWSVIFLRNWFTFSAGGFPGAVASNTRHDQAGAFGEFVGIAEFLRNCGDGETQRRAFFGGTLADVEQLILNGLGSSGLLFGKGGLPGGLLSGELRLS